MALVSAFVFAFVFVIVLAVASDALPLEEALHLDDALPLEEAIQALPLEVSSWQ